jgi:hypothetical protein
MDKEKIKQALSSISGKMPNEILYSLEYEIKGLSRQEKSLIYSLAINQPIILKDGDLVKLIEEHRTALRNMRGSLQEDLDEVSLIIKAWRSPQYKKYIKHMMISFLNESLVFPVEGKFEDECGICHKPLYQYSNWKMRCENNPGFGEQNRKEYLSIGSRNSKNSICTNCLVQLGIAYDLLEYLYPGFLTKSF